MSPIDKQKYLKLFQSEAEPHFQKIKEATERLSVSGTDPGKPLDDLARSYHYLKGALGLIGQKDLREIAVETEKIIKQIFADNRQASEQELKKLADTALEIRETVNRLLNP